MKDRIALATPLAKDTARQLQAGDEVLVSGVIGLAGPAFCLRVLESQLPESGLPLQDRILVCCPGTAEEQFLGKAFEWGISGVLACGAYSPALLRAAQEHGVVFFNLIDGEACNHELTEQLKHCEARSDETLCEWAVTDFPALVAVTADGSSMELTGRKDGGAL